MADRALVPMSVGYLLVAVMLPCGCTSNQPGSGTQYISLGTAPVGGAFDPVGSAVSDVLNDHKGSNNWKVQKKGTKGSQDNIRRLQQGELQLALSNSAITHFAVRGQADWEDEFDVQAVVTMAPNVAMFITQQDSGIRSIADLAGKRVVIGPAGAGFEMFVQPLIVAHGITFDDFTKLNASQSDAVDMLADGHADAAFLGGAIPTAAVVRACNEQDIFFVPFDPAAVENLLAEYPFFQPVTIPAGTYSDLPGEFAGLNVGSMHLITAADADEETIYQITKTIWEHREEIAHPAAKSINPSNAARYTGTPFHPGAQRYYEEVGIWPEGANQQDAASDGSNTD